MTKPSENSQSAQPLGLPLNDGLGVDEHRRQYEQEWRPTEQERKAAELAERYHRETEAYDRTVCSGPIRDGSVMPIGPHEMALVNRNAIKEPQGFCVPANRGDCAGWAGVRITVEAVPDLAPEEQAQSAVAAAFGGLVQTPQG